MHLVLASRIEPPLPLARLRVREELFEVRTQDLRFTSAETTLFFTHTADHLHLSPHQLQLVEARTEGWVAGLQLVALSLRGQDSYDTALTAFTGNTRHVLDYLVEEILSQQPAQTQAFLLYTSLVERLTGSLCDALTGQHDRQEMLEHLEAANSFFCHWIPSVPGIAIIVFSLRQCSRNCGDSNRRLSLLSISRRVAGMSNRDG